MLRLTLAQLFLALMAVPAFAHDPVPCESGRDVPVTVTPVFDEPRFDASQGLASIQAIAGDKRHSIPQYHSTTMGITRYEPILEFHVPAEIESVPGGPGCVRIGHIDVTVGYRDVTVYIAHEIMPGSCGFQETLEHEEKHIAVNRQLLDEYVPLIEDRFRSYVQLNGTFRVDRAEDAKPLIDQKLQAIMDEMMQRMETENIRRQREIDSPGEYDRLSHVCNGDLGRLAYRFRHGGG